MCTQSGLRHQTDIPEALDLQDGATVIDTAVMACLLGGGGGPRGGGTPTGWPHTAQSGKPDCRGPEAKPHQRDTPNTPIPGDAQCPDQKT
jgi:hypothetical protein